MHLWNAYSVLARIGFDDPACALLSLGDTGLCRAMPLGMGKLNPEQQRNYVNFYGNLMKALDQYLVQILDALKTQNPLDHTLVIQMVPSSLRIPRLVPATPTSGRGLFRDG